MSLAQQCVNTNTKEWEIHLADHGGVFADAWLSYIQNGYDYSDSVKSRAQETSSIKEDVKEPESSDPYLDAKKTALKKAKTLLLKKIRRLKARSQRHPELTEYVEKLTDLTNKMHEHHAEEGLVNFIKAAKSMTNSALDKMKKLKSGEEELNLRALHSINDHVNSLDMLEDLREEFFTDDTKKEEYRIVRDILDSRRSLKADYIDLMKQAIVAEIAPNYGKEKAIARRNAEIEFNREVLPNLKKRGYSKADIKESKKNYIATYLSAKASEIDKKTREELYKQLGRTTDMSSMNSWLVNPKDHNHSIMDMAVRKIDEAAFEITDKVRRKRYELQSLYEDYVEHQGRNGDPKKMFDPLFVKADGKTLPFLMNPEAKGWADFVKKYDGTPVWHLQQFLMEMCEEKNKMVPRGYQLDYRIPFINKSSMERLYANGVWHTIKEGAIDKFKVRAEDTEFGDAEQRKIDGEESDQVEIAVGESGKEREVIPILYRNRELVEEEQSYDILTAMLLDYKNSVNFNVKTNTAIFLEGLKDVVSEAEIIQTSGYKQIYKVDRDSKEIHTIKGQGSNLLRSLESLIRHRVYNIEVEGDPQLAKISQTVKNYTSVVQLSINYLSAAANLFHGTTLSWIDAAGKNTGAYGIKDRLAGMKKYDFDLIAITNDIGKRVPKSKTNLLIEKFNAFNDFHSLEDPFVENNRMKRLVKTNALMFANNTGDHMVQSGTMYAVMNNIKVLDKDGNFLDKDFNPTKNRDEALSLDEAMSVSEKGELEFHESVASTERSEGISTKDMANISKYIQNVLRDLYGNYSGANKSMLRKTVLGNMVIHMRGWLIPGVQRRWIGIGKSGTLVEDLRSDQIRYNDETGEIKEGTYTTTVRYIYRSFIRNLKKDVQAVKMFTPREVWSELTDTEKANIRKTILELGIGLVAILASSAFMGDDDDEDRNIYAAYLSRRLYSELFTFINPNEATRTFKSPMMTVNMVENALDFIYQGVVDPTEVYETGRNKGDLKLYKRFTKLVPVMKEIYGSDVEDKHAFLSR